MKRLLQILKPKKGSPPIFADLAIETRGMIMAVNVEELGWLDKHQDNLAKADRVGLLYRGIDEPVVWLTVNGAEPRYLSRVIGKIDDIGHHQYRVAGLQCGDVFVWLHHDGVVEVSPEPTFRRD